MNYLIGFNIGTLSIGFILIGRSEKNNILFVESIVLKKYKIERIK